MKSPKHEPIYHTTKSLALERGVKSRTVLNWIKSGLIIGQRLGGGHWRIPRHNYINPKYTKGGVK